MRLYSKLLQGTCRALAKYAFHSSLRVFALRIAGVKIGKDIFINGGLTLICSMGCEKDLLIEDRASIASNVTLVMTSNPNFSRLRELKKIYPSVEVEGKIHIKHDAWIGAHCLILPNVTIGEFSIVGAGSVVTKDVQPFTVVAGVPAKVIKKLPEMAIEKLKETEVEGL